MTSDFDCRVGRSDCTNRSGTADDSWSGALDAGEHKIVVYPRTGASGSYTLTVSVETPGTGGSEGTTTQVTTLVDVSRTGVSRSQTHSFALSGSAEVEVALTGLTIDFDCRVGSSRCTNRWGTRDDSWSGSLGQGNHSVVVYPYDPGPGNYSLTVTATETQTSVETPFGGGPVLMGRICDADEDGNAIEDTCENIYADGITVTGDDPGPPPGAGPGEGDPGPGDGGGDGGGGGGGGGPTTPQEPTDEQKDQMESDAITDATARARNETCRMFFKDHNRNFDLVATVSAANFVRGDPRGRCTDTAFAYVARGNPRGTNTIWTCDRFYTTTRDLRADAVLHEMLHLAGKSHEDLGGEALFHEKVMNACS